MTSKDEISVASTVEVTGGRRATGKKRVGLGLQVKLDESSMDGGDERAGAVDGRGASQRLQWEANEASRRAERYSRRCESSERARCEGF